MITRDLEDDFYNFRIFDVAAHKYRDDLDRFALNSWKHVFMKGLFPGDYTRLNPAEFIAEIYVYELDQDRKRVYVGDIVEIKYANSWKSFYIVLKDSATLNKEILYPLNIATYFKVIGNVNFGFGEKI